MAREKVAVALVTQSNGMQERIILCDQDEIRLGRDKGMNSSSQSLEYRGFMLP